MKVTKYVHARDLGDAQTAAEMGFLYDSAIAARNAAGNSRWVRVFKVEVEIECIEVSSLAKAVQ